MPDQGSDTLRKYLNWLPILFLLASMFWLRLANLGYSDLQGDEIKALVSLEPGQSLLDFILEQPRGPTQFLVTSLINLIQPGYTSRLLLRLPFACAGILAVWIFYQFVWLRFGKRIGLYSAFFFGLNGLFIGLGRIVQYQPFVLLFSTLTLYLLERANKTERLRIVGVYLAALCWALAILTHYDGIFIAPMVLYLVYEWYRAPNGVDRPTRRKHLLLAVVAMGMILGGYFIPFILSITSDTQTYWLERFAGEGAAELIPSSIATFNLYNPTVILPLYLAMLVFSLVEVRRLAVVMLWALLPWIVFEAVLYDPGTHIYTYLFPVCILAGAGLQVLETGIKRVLKGTVGNLTTITVATGVFSFLFLVAHLIFIDHTPEYPWNPRGILGWKVDPPIDQYRMWVFGFPYQRKWDQIGGYIKEDQASAYYSTNETKPIANYHIGLPFDIDRAGYYIHIYQPQSFRDRLVNEKIHYWIKKHPPVKTFENNGVVVAEIFLMPAGTLEQIRQAGY